MLLWMIPFFFLIFPWKIVLPRGFWNSAAAEFAAGLHGIAAADARMDSPDKDLKSDSQQGQISVDFWESENEQKMQVLQNAESLEKRNEREALSEDRDISGERQEKSRHILADLWRIFGSVQKDLLMVGEGRNRVISVVLPATWGRGCCFYFCEEQYLTDV